MSHIVFGIELYHYEQLQAKHTRFQPNTEVHCKQGRSHADQTQSDKHQNTNGITDLLQLFKVLPQELHRTLRLGDAEVHNALFQDLLDVVLLHEDFTALQTLVFFQSGGGGGGHLIAYPWGSGGTGRGGGGAVMGGEVVRGGTQGETGLSNTGWKK